MTDIEHAVKVLVRTLRDDEGYREAWKANIAMAFYDEFNRTYPDHNLPRLHEIANEAAGNFLNLLAKDSQ